MTDPKPSGRDDLARDLCPEARIRQLIGLAAVNSYGAEWMAGELLALVQAREAAAREQARAQIVKQIKSACQHREPYLDICEACLTAEEVKVMRLSVTRGASGGAVAANRESDARSSAGRAAGTENPSQGEYGKQVAGSSPAAQAATPPPSAPATDPIVGELMYGPGLNVSVVDLRLIAAWIRERYEAAVPAPGDGPGEPRQPSYQELRDALEIITSTAKEVKPGNTGEFMEWLADRIRIAESAWERSAPSAAPEAPREPAPLAQPDHGHEPQHGNSMREILEEVTATPAGPNGMYCVILTEGQWLTLRQWIETVYVDALNKAVEAVRAPRGEDVAREALKAALKIMDGPTDACPDPRCEWCETVSKLRKALRALDGAGTAP